LSGLGGGMSEMKKILLTPLISDYKSVMIALYTYVKRLTLEGRSR
jgi:hypothetical protein